MKSLADKEIVSENFLFSLADIETRLIFIKNVENELRNVKNEFKIGENPFKNFENELPRMHL